MYSLPLHMFICLSIRFNCLFRMTLLYTVQYCTHLILRHECLEARGSREPRGRNAVAEDHRWLSRTASRARRRVPTTARAGALATELEAHRERREDAHWRSRVLKQRVNAEFAERTALREAPALRRR